MGGNIRGKLSGEHIPNPKPLIGLLSNDMLSCFAYLNPKLKLEMIACHHTSTKYKHEPCIPNPGLRAMILNAISVLFCRSFYVEEESPE